MSRRAETSSNEDVGRSRDPDRDETGGLGVPLAYHARAVSRGTPLRRASAAALVDSCRVPDSVNTGTAGLWTLRRVAASDLPNPISQVYFRHAIGGYDRYTVLERATLATMHREHGECVMEDSARELRRHLPILLAARGQVLITGLGLGCVLRGLLAKPEVEHIDVVEIDRDILALCGAEFRGNPRVTLHFGDAETIAWPTWCRWDFAWHDVWAEHEHLDLLHARLLARYAPLAQEQGAWQLDRAVKRRWPLRRLLNASRRVRA